MTGQGYLRAWRGREETEESINPPQPFISPKTPPLRPSEIKSDHIIPRAYPRANFCPFPAVPPLSSHFVSAHMAPQVCVFLPRILRFLYPHRSVILNEKSLVAQTRSFLPTKRKIFNSSVRPSSRLHRPSRHERNLQSHLAETLRTTMSKKSTSLARQRNVLQAGKSVPQTMARNVQPSASERERLPSR